MAVLNGSVGTGGMRLIIEGCYDKGVLNISINS